MYRLLKIPEQQFNIKLLGEQIINFKCSYIPYLEKKNEKYLISPNKLKFINTVFSLFSLKDTALHIDRFPFGKISVP